MRSRRPDRAEVGHDMAAHRASWEEYLAIDAASPTKNAYFDGQILAMAGGSEEHALLSMNMGVALSLALRGRPCRVYSSDLRVRVAATGLGTYPDVTVVCGASERDGETVLNPIVIVEVLSGSTEGYDRGEKFDHYKQVPTLREYVLVEQGRARIERFHRDEAGRWVHDAWTAGGVVTLPSLGVAVAVDDVYVGVEAVRTA